MFNSFVKILVVIAIGSLVMVGSAFASTVENSLPDVSYTWSSADYWTGTQPDVDFTLVLHKDNKLGAFGLYSVVDINAAADPYHMAIFDDSDALGAEATILFDPNGDAKLYKGVSETVFTDFGSVFGFYGKEEIGSPSFWYTDITLNSDGMEHVFVASQDGSNPALDNAHVYIAKGFDKTVLGEMAIKDIAPVPEPATMLLFGAGLMGLATVSRRKRNNK